MANRKQIEKEIQDYCSLNGIKNVPNFITQCLEQGFNIQRYGLNPQDNIQKENNTSKMVEESKEPIRKTKRTIKIISND